MMFSESHDFKQKIANNLKSRVIADEYVHSNVIGLCVCVCVHMCVHGGMRVYCVCECVCMHNYVCACVMRVCVHV